MIIILQKVRQSKIIKDSKKLAQEVLIKHLIDNLELIELKKAKQETQVIALVKAYLKYLKMGFLKLKNQKKKNKKK